MGLVRIDLDDGKYTALYNEEHGGVTVLRYGEPWRNETGDKFILLMILRIRELEEELSMTEKKLERCVAFDYSDVIKAEPEGTFDLPIEFEWDKENKS